MKYFYLIFFLIPNLLPAQKLVEKSIVNPEIKAISIDAANIFELSVDTGEGTEMVLEANIDGEYKNDLLLNVRQSGNTLLVSTGFQPDFKTPNDKLGAHKVISVGLKVLLPIQKRVTIFGTDSHVTAKGRYQNLKVTLSNGQCVIDRVSKTVTVSTQSGTISVIAKAAEIEAESKYGKVRGDYIPSGSNRYDLSSVTGDILLNKAE